MRKTGSRICGPGILGLTVIWILVSNAACADEVQRIPIEELKGLLNNPDVIVLDVRAPGDWEGSDSKIQGAIRETWDNFDDWADKYPKDKTLVLYCA
jgi:predicted sulfurtransferase